MEPTYPTKEFEESIKRALIDRFAGPSYLIQMLSRAGQKIASRAVKHVYVQLKNRIGSNPEKRFKSSARYIEWKRMSIFPADVNPNQLAAFLKSVYASDGVVHVHKVALDLHWDLTKLLPILDAAEMLGLVTVEKGEAKLSREGHRMLSVKKGRRLAVGNSLSRIEPFTTALRFKKKFTGEDVAKELSKKGIRWHHEDEVNSLIVSEILMHWGIRGGLLDYDGSGFTVNIKNDSSS